MADIRVFISSVQREFAQERRQLCDYIRTDGLLGRFFVPFIFEDMPASEVSAHLSLSKRTTSVRLSIVRKKCQTQPQKCQTRPKK